MLERNEAHVTNVPNGHAMDVDCWCEPSKIYWTQNVHGVKILVVEHNDFTLAHHNAVLSVRERALAQGVRTLASLDSTWITEVLESLFKPPQLPPHLGAH